MISHAKLERMNQLLCFLILCRLPIPNGDIQSARFKIQRGRSTNLCFLLEFIHFDVEQVPKLGHFYYISYGD